MSAPSTPSVYYTSYSGLNATIYWTRSSDTAYTCIWTAWNNQYVYPSGSSYTITLPNYNTTYYVQLANVNSSHEYSAWSSLTSLYVQSIPRPSTPYGISVSYSGLNATIRWSKDSYTAKTKIWTNWNGATYETTGSSYTVTLPQANTTYNFQLQAVNSEGYVSDWSSATSLYVQDIPRPSAPYGVSATYSGLTATIRWSKDSYTSKTKIWTEWNGYTYETTGTSYSVTLPSKGTTYYFQLQAVNSEDEVSSWTSKYDCPLYVASAPLPSMPSGISTSNSGLNVTISWIKGTNAVDTAIWTEWDNQTYYTSGSSYQVTVPSKNQYYYFQLASINVDRQYSSWTPKDNGRIYIQGLPVPSLPSNINVTYSGMTATVTWSKGANATSTSLWSNWDDKYYSTTGTSYSFTVPKKDTSYYIQLQSVNADGVSEWTPSSSCPIFIASVPAPTIPTNISVSYSGMIATISWTKGTNAVNTAVLTNWDGQYYYTTGSTYQITVPNKGTNYYVQLASINSENVYSSWTPSDSCKLFIPNRPFNFTGSLYKVVNNEDRVDTANWIAFANRVNEFRVYKGYLNYDFALTRTSATVGNNFTASIFNEMISGMSTICSGLPSAKSSGDNVLKSYFDTLVTQLNNVT